MTTLDPDPFVVSVVQFAATFPIFLFALPAGAIADIVDRRRLLVVTQMAAVVLAGTFGFIVFFGHVSAGGLIVFSLLAATAAALVMPAWQTIVPQLVPRPLLQSAVALNSVGLNVSRALGPALAGIVIAAWGMAAPFWFNSLTTAGVVAALGPQPFDRGDATGARLDHPDHCAIGQLWRSAGERAGADVGGFEPRPHRLHRARDRAAGDCDGVPGALLVGL